jgi:hypothetical protein
MSRALRLCLIVAAGLALLAGGFLWALPEIVRRVALDQIPKRTGRAVAIGDVDLNVFSGRLRITGFRLADRDGPAPLVAFERFDVRLSPLALLRSHVHVREFTLAAPTVRIVRTGPAEFNFSDLLVGRPEPVTPPPPTAAPRPWTVTVERLTIAGGRAEVADQAVTPAAEWLLQDLAFDVTGLTTRSMGAPGRLDLRARVNETALTLGAEGVRLDPLGFRAQLGVAEFPLRRLIPYVHAPLGLRYRPSSGRLAVALTAEVDSDAQEVRKATVSGTVRLDGEALTRTGGGDPFLSASRIAAEVKEADIVARTLTVASLIIEGLDAKVRRDAQGVIDVVEMFGERDVPPAPASAAAPGPSTVPSTGPAPSTVTPPAAGVPPTAPGTGRTLFPVIQGLAAGFAQILVERATISPSTALWVDEGTTPTTRLALADLEVHFDGFTWPVKGPAAVSLSTRMPGGGRLEITGPMTVYPFDTELVVLLRDAAVAPYQGYIPIPALLSGRFSGDSKNRIAVRDGVFVAQSKGNSWAQDVEIREPGAARAAIRVERMDLTGIDFDWPRRATLVSAGFRRPRVEIERAADGSFNVRRLFAPRTEKTEAPPPGPPPGPASAEAEPRGLRETMRLHFGKVRIEDGMIRFLDRTTQPVFSQELSRLELTVTDFGNRPDRRAKLLLQSVVGGDAGLDIRGEIGALGAPTLVDLVGELRNFKLPSVDPYAATNIGWIIKKGDLQYRVRFKLDGDQLAAHNELVVGQLQVAPAQASDEVKRRIGLPLGLIVALIKDQKGEIRATIPVTGAVNDPKVGLRDAIWTAVKNVLTNIVTAPFKAIGRLFSRGEKVEEPTVDPVTFAAGSAVVSPAMEEHLLRVADFLRRAPFVNLSLSAIPSAGDVDALKDQAVAARLQEFRKERGLEDAAVALDEYYKARLPDVPRPATPEAQIAGLREREAAPDAALAELARRRVEVTRERLVQAEGIPEARLTTGAVPAAADAPSPPTPAGEGRVEFQVVAGE